VPFSGIDCCLLCLRFGIPFPLIYGFEDGEASGNTPVGGGLVGERMGWLDIHDSSGSGTSTGLEGWWWMPLMWPAEDDRTGITLGETGFSTNVVEGDMVGAVQCYTAKSGNEDTLPTSRVPWCTHSRKQ